MLMDQAARTLARPEAGADWPRGGRDLAWLALPDAGRICAQITRRYSRSFALAASLLPPAKRRAVQALYAFCRVSDELADSAEARAQPGRAAQALAAWRAYALAPAVAGPPPAGWPGVAPAEAWAAALAFGAARARYAIPVRYAHQLIAGITRDLRPSPCATFRDMAAYAYAVAGTVGLMSVPILGAVGPAGRPAAQLGMALQLTNILRDVGEDAAAGRIYLPQAELRAFGLAPADVAAGRLTDRWRDFMRFQIVRVRALYARARPGIACLHPSGRLAVHLAAALYAGILADIEAHDYDVFSRRAHVSGWQKVRVVVAG
jgi:phytoene synthase